MTTFCFFGDRMVYARRSSIETGSLSEYYVHQDHLGSVDRLTHLIDGQIDRHYSFDAFGKRRNTTWTDDASDSLMADTALQWTERGYTGHEHLDPVKLIHMNGRVQDPILGRMMSADPLLGDLTDPQSLNRYSYVRNNPLALTDPSGFVTCSENEEGVWTCDVTAQPGEPDTVVVTAQPGQEPDGTIEVTAHLRFDDYVNSWSVFTIDMNDVGDQSSAWQVQSSGQTAAPDLPMEKKLDQLEWATPIPQPVKAAIKGVGGGISLLPKIASYLRSLIGRSSSSNAAKSIAPQIAKIEKQLAQHGRPAVERSLRSLEGRAAEARQQIETYKAQGGYTSSVERELRAFQAEIQAIKEVLGRGP